MHSDENESSSSQKSGTGDEAEGESSPIENKPFRVVLKGGSPWGFVLRGGSKVRAPLQINEIHDGGKTQKNGKICTGDYILSINDVRCSTLKEADQLVHSAFRTLTLLVWRGNVQTKALLRSSSFLRRAREIQERERYRSGIQDDSIVFSESKRTVGLDMKAKQRRIESFNGGKAGGRTVTASPSGRATSVPSNSLSSPLSSSVYADYGQQRPPSPRLTTTAPPASIKKLANWATISDLSSKNRPLSVHTGNLGYQKSHRTGPLSPSKSSPSLNHMTENVPPYSQYAAYTNTQASSISYAMSTPDISVDQKNAQHGPQSPSWYQQKLCKPLFDFNLTDMDVREMVVDNGKYANPTYSEFAARLNAGKKPERHSLPKNMMPRYNDYQNLKDLQITDNLKSNQAKQNSYSTDNSLDNEIPDIQPSPSEDVSRPLYSPPAPPVRDISSLKYIGMNQAHEKYPSWPVSSPNTDMSVSNSVRSANSSWLNNSKFDVKKISNQPYQPQLHPLKEGSSPITEYRNDEKPSRNASDPGFKSPSPLKQFIKRKVPMSRDKELNYKESKSNHFEDIIKSKPGYPLPVRDSDGHSYGDEKYSIPSPPERDIPGVDERSLGEKITSLVTPSYVDRYHGELRVSADQKNDLTTSPLQSPLVDNQTGSAYHYKSNIPLKAFPIPQNKVDMATSPLQCPNESKFILGGFPNNNRSVAASQHPWEKNRGFIVKPVVTPYYNTGTQTDDFSKSSKSQAKRPRQLLLDSQPTQTQGEKGFHDMSVQAHMSSQCSDSDVTSPKGDVTVSTVDSKNSLIQAIPSDYSAPMLRKLSEEYFQGRLQGGHIDKRHSTSSSFDMGARSPAFGSLKEADSYSSVIIHPGESSKPFGKDYENISNISEQDLINYEQDSNYSQPSKGRYSLDPSMLKTHSSSKMPQRSLHDSRYNSEQILSSPNYNNLTDNNVSSSMLDIKSEQSRVSRYSSSDTSLPSQPRSSDDTRTSKSSSFGSDFSPLGTQNLHIGPNDSVFIDNKSPVATVSNFTESQNVMSRKISMKKAYGTYDEFDKLLEIHKKQIDPTSNFTKDRRSNSDYVTMDSYRGLGQILEDSAESRCAENMQNSSSLYQNTVVVEKNIITKESEKRGEPSNSNDHNSSADRDYEEMDISKTVSDLTPINMESATLNKENVKKVCLKENETDNTTMADHRNSSDPDLKKVQQEAVLNFMERYTNTRRPASFHICKPSQSSSNDMPSSGEQSPKKKNIQISKIQKPENLRRTRSISSPKDTNAVDYSEMKHPQTEWRTVRSQMSTSNHDGFKRPLSLGSEASLSDNYAISPLSPCSSNADVADDIHSRTYQHSSCVKQQKAAVHKNRSSSAGEQKISQTITNAESTKSAGSGSPTTVAPPLYQNIRYLRPPPVPPPDGAVVEEKPPTLPPRNYQKFHFSHSDSALRTSHETKKDNSLFSSSHNQNTDSPQDSSQDSYRDELRKYAKKYSKQQFPPAAFSLVSTKTQSSCSQSFKREPVQSYEATSPRGSVSTSPLTTSNSIDSVSSYSVQEQNGHPESKSAALLQASSPEPPPLPPPPSLLPPPSPRSLEGVLNDLPPRPPEPNAESFDIEKFSNNRGYADDSYASAVFQKSRQPGVYKRSMSAGDALRALAEKNNYKEESVNSSPQRLDQSQREEQSQWTKTVNSEQQQNSENSVPLFQAAEVVQQYVYRHTAEPLRPAPQKTPVINQSYLSSPIALSSDTSKSNVAPSSGENQFIKSNSDVLVPQTNATPDSRLDEQTKEHTSVKDRILNLEKISRSPNVQYLPRINLKSNASSPRNSLERSQLKESLPSVPARTYLNQQPSTNSRGNPKHNLSPQTPHLRHPPSLSDPLISSYPKQPAQSQSFSKPPLPLSFARRTDPTKFGTPTQGKRQEDQNRFYVKENAPNVVRDTSVHSVAVNKHNRRDISPKHTTEKLTSDITIESVPTFNTNIQHVEEQSKVHSDTCYAGDVASADRCSGSSSVRQNSPKVSHSSETFGNRTNNQYLKESVRHSFDGNSEQLNKSDELQNEYFERTSTSSDVFVDNILKDNNKLQSIHPASTSSDVFVDNVLKDNNKLQSIHPASTSSDVFVDNVSKDNNKLQAIHPRQPSQEELECEVKVQEFVKELPESDKNLTNVLKPENKGRMHYMNGLFMDSLSISRESFGSRHSLTTISKEESQSSNQHSTSEKIEDSSPGRQESTSLPPTYWVSPSRAMMEMEIRKCDEAHQEFTKDIENNDILMKKKGELMESIVKKIDILKEERRELQKEIEDNDCIGRKIDSLVEQKCQGHRRDKFRSYIDDMDKIVKLLLKLSGLLARAENAFQSLPTNAADHQKKSALEKRDKLREQHEEAQSLKSDIDKRKEQVSTFLSDCFTELELEDYTYFVKMKSKLTIQTQELDDKIKLGEEQLQALQRSIPDS